MKTKHRVTDCNGKVHTRISQSKIYSHAVVVHLAAEPDQNDPKYGTLIYGARAASTDVTWCSRPDLAAKQAAARSQSGWRYHPTKVEILKAEIF